MPKTVLDVTVKDQDGVEIFHNEKEFSVADLYFKGGKQVAMAEWDVTATEHFNLGLQPLETETNTFIIPVKPGIKFVDIETSFSYLYTRDTAFAVKKVVKKVMIK